MPMPPMPPRLARLKAVNNEIRAVQARRRSAERKVVESMRVYGNACLDHGDVVGGSESIRSLTKIVKDLQTEQKELRATLNA